MTEFAPGFTLVVLTGPTGSGKSDLAIKIARELHCHIISADSRQIFKDIPIGTAAPTPGQLAAVPHHFVGTLPLDAYYSAAAFESDTLRLLASLSHESPYAVMCGGSMMYIDAVMRGIDPLPTVSDAIRAQAYGILEREGTHGVIERLRTLDPQYLENVDLNNHKRLVHALEICMEAGVPYSSLCTGKVADRPFRIVPMAMNPPREVMFSRINARVDKMMEQGLEEEARSVYHLRHLNSLNTVGYKEMFALFDGTFDRITAVARLAKNTRVYAKKQLTWLKRRPEFTLLPWGDEYTAAMNLISGKPAPDADVRGDAHT